MSFDGYKQTQRVTKYLLSVQELQERYGREVQVPRRVYKAKQCSKARDGTKG